MLTAGVNDAFVYDTNGILTAGEVRKTALSPTSVLLSFNTDNDATIELQILLANGSSVLAAGAILL